MTLEWGKHSLTVRREPGDPAYRTESTLLHHIKMKLNANGGDFIKKRMWRDGHLVADEQQYIRNRKIGPGAIALWNTHWAITGLDTDWRADGEAVLAIEDMGS